MVPTVFLAELIVDDRHLPVLDQHPVRAVDLTVSVNQLCLVQDLRVLLWEPLRMRRGSLCKNIQILFFLSGINLTGIEGMPDGIG